MRIILFPVIITIVILILSACETDFQGPVVDLENNGYERVAVAEVLVKTCATSGCHAGTNPAAGFSTENHSKLFDGALDKAPDLGKGFGGEVVIPFNSDKSLIFQILLGNVTPAGPHESLDFSQERIEIIKDWIDQGAKDFNGLVPFSNPPYRVYVCNQASDMVSVIDGQRKVVSRLTDVNFNQTIDAPHMVKEFGDFYYVTLIAAGKLLKIRKSDNTIVGETNGIEKAGMIQISPDGSTGFVSRSSTSASIYNSVYAVSLNDMSIISEINMPVTGVPHALALTPDGSKLYSANLTKDRVSIINAVSREFVDDIILDQGTEPMEATVSPDGKFLYISGMGTGKLIVIDVASDQVVSSIDLNPMPMHIAVSSDGNRIYVSTMMMSTVEVIQKSGNVWTKIKSITHPGFSMLHGCDLTSDDKYLYVSSRNVNGMYVPKFRVDGEGNNGTLGIIDTETLEVVKVLDLEEFPSGLTVEKASD